MIVSRLTTAATAIGVALVLTSCSTGAGTGQATAGGGSGLDRTDARQVADAVATAYAAGDFAGTCALADAELRSRLESDDQCTGQGSWNETATFKRGCLTTDGTYGAAYDTSGHVDRFLRLVVHVADIDGQWTATRLIKETPGSQQGDPRNPSIQCADTTTAATTPTSGG